MRVVSYVMLYDPAFLHFGRILRTAGTAEASCPDLETRNNKSRGHRYFEERDPEARIRKLR